MAFKKIKFNGLDTEVRRERKSVVVYFADGDFEELDMSEYKRVSAARMRDIIRARSGAANKVERVIYVRRRYLVSQLRHVMSTLGGEVSEIREFDINTGSWGKKTVRNEMY